MKAVVWLLVVALVVLHQDNWFWDDNRLLLGFMPVGLLYHAGISLAAGIVWYLATIFAWPVQEQYKAPPEVVLGEEGARHEEGAAS